MKKFYSLLAAVALTATVSAQTTVVSTITGINGAGVVATTNNPADTNLTFKADAGASTANAPAYFGVSGSTPGHLRLYSVRATGEGNTFTVTPAAGYIITSVTFTVLTDKPTVTYNVAGGATQTATLADATYTLTNATETTGAVTFKNAHTGGSNNLQLRIPAITVTYKATPTMAVVDATKGKANLVKNTIVSNELIFGASAKVSVYNTAGQIVKTAEVSDNSRLDVSALPKGTYVVTGLVNGQAVSQKVIKK
ncbi:MAG: T9SS type A sorting domain-containing protein [Chryseobacterium sp.]|nr:T9SS type A sorting domain-containing protein [Chryseobacterium sp.]